MKRIVMLSLCLVGLLGCTTSILSVQHNFKKIPDILTIQDTLTPSTVNDPAFANYRQYLIPMLNNDHFVFHFIGPQHDTVSSYLAFLNRSIEELTDQAYGIIQRYPADIVILQLGHHSLGENAQVKVIVANMTTIINQVRRRNSLVTILIGEVQTVNNAPEYAYISALNQQLAKLAQMESTPDSRVKFVRQYDGLEAKTDLTTYAHPNHHGAKKLAVIWAHALQPFLL